MRAARWRPADTAPGIVRTSASPPDNAISYVVRDYQDAERIAGDRRLIMTTRMREYTCGGVMGRPSLRSAEGRQRSPRRSADPLCRMSCSGHDQELARSPDHLAPGMAPEAFRGVRIISLSWSPFTESNRRPSPYHLVARRSMLVVRADRRLMRASWGRSWAMRLLHSAATPLVDLGVVRPGLL
jgi:hypothetical protein